MNMNVSSAVDSLIYQASVEDDGNYLLSKQDLTDFIAKNKNSKDEEIKKLIPIAQLLLNNLGAAGADAHFDKSEAVAFVSGSGGDSSLVDPLIQKASVADDGNYLLSKQDLTDFIAKNKNSKDPNTKALVSIADTLLKNIGSSGSDAHFDRSEAIAFLDGSTSDPNGGAAFRLFSEVKAKGGHIILDWDDTIDIDDHNTLGATATKWLNEMAESGVDVYMVSKNVGGKGIRSAVLNAVDPENRAYWENVFDHQSHFGSGDKRDDYQEIIGESDPSTWMLVDDFRAVTKGEGYVFQPSAQDQYATYDKMVKHLSQFVDQLSG